MRYMANTVLLLVVFVAAIIFDTWWLYGLTAIYSGILILARDRPGYLE
jgi:hypothetical protein